MPLVKNPGTVIRLDGVAYVMPPLSLGAVEQMGDLFTDFASGKMEVNAHTLKPLIDLILAALRRNYPDLARDVVAFNLDLGNVEATFRALMQVSGLVREVPPEESASGEADAAAAG